MGQHTRQHVMVPPRLFAHFVVIHPEFGFRFLEALFDRPPDPTEPDQQAQRDTQGGVAQVVPVPRLRPEGALHEQPHGRGRLAILTQQEPFAGELVRDRAFGPLRHGPAIPERRGQGVSHLGDGAWRGVGHRDALGAWHAFIRIRMGGRGERLEPTPRVRRRRHERDGAHTRLACRPEVRAVAIEAVRYNILKR